MKTERRKQKRYAVRNLLVTERSGDFEYVLPVENMSEGGLFLRGKLATSPYATLQIPMKTNNLSIEAQAMFEQTIPGKVGVGYRFLNVSKAQNLVLRRFLAKLN